MRRRTNAIREVNSGGRAAAASPGLRATLLWIYLVAAILLVGRTGRAQSSAGHNANSSSSGSGAPARIRAASNFARLPLNFEENRGQTDPQVKFLSRGPEYTLFLTQKEAVFAMAGKPGRGGASGLSALRLRFSGANAGVQVGGEDKLPGITNYFPSGDRSTWHSGIPNYSRVQYQNVYPGVNADFHGNPQRLEFDFEVAPGADPSTIALDVSGGRALRLDGDGNIVLGVGRRGRDGEVTLGKPVVYQQIAGVRNEIAGRFVLRGAHRIGFQLGKYDRTQPLVIDPSISYASYLGSSTADGIYGSAIAVDSSGSAYVVGYVIGSTFPGSSGASVPQGAALFISKFTPDGSGVVYTDLFWQAAASGAGELGVAVDSNQSAYIAGASYLNMATTGAYSNQSTNGLPELTVMKLSPDGSEPDYIAQIGPVTNTNVGIAVDSSFSAYVTSATNSGNAADFPTTTGAYQTTSTCQLASCEQATVSKLSPDGSTLVYSTFLGGSSDNWGTGIAVDGQGDAYVTGVTTSYDFPTTSGAVQTEGGNNNAFLAELNSSGSGLVYATFLGFGVSIELGAPQVVLDAAGNIYLSGTTNSNSFASALLSTSGPTNLGPPEQCAPPTTAYCAQLPDGGYDLNAFVAELAAGGSQLAYLGFLGGYSASPPAGTSDGTTLGYSIGVDPGGRIMLAGATGSSFFPVTSDAWQSSCNCVVDAGNEVEDGQVATFTIIDPTTSGTNSLVFSTYLGSAPITDGTPDDAATGIALDNEGNAYLAGSVQNSTVPATAGAFQATCPNTTYGCYSLFVAKIVTGLSAPSAAITAVSGGGQSATIGQAFANPLVVNVTDSSGNPVSGVTVTFTAPSSGASATLSSATATTGSSGNAQVTATANGIASASAYTVSASVAGVTTPATFSLTNTQAATTLTVTPSALSLVYGQMVTINASISPANVAGSAPTGSVAFYDGTTALTPDSTVSGAAASYTVNVPTVGTHTYAAQYLGDTNFQPSALASAASAVTVSKASVTLTGPATQPVRIQSGQTGSISVSIAGQYTGSGIATPTGGLSYSVSGNAFEPGSLLVANGTATISVPATVAAGTYTVTVSYAGDSNYNAASVTIQLTVYEPISITPATLPTGVVGTPYSERLTATGGSGSGYSWTVTSGAAFSAVGLTLSSSGVISGSPTATESTASVTVQVTDSLGDLATQTYHLTIYPALAITPTTLPTGVVGRSYSQTLTATGGSGSGYQWGVTSGTALSAVGLTLSSAGVISGTPTEAETAAPFTVDVVDSLGNVTIMAYHLTINPTLSITPATLPVGTVGKAYSQQLSASGGSGTGYTWSIIAGASNLTSLGLSLTTAGLMSGTPSGAGQANITIQVTDSLGDNATQNYLVTVDPALSIAPATLPAGTVGTTYSQQLSATGGSGTGYTWSITADAAGLTSLGLSLSSAGLISGTPTSAEQVDFTVQVTDSLGDTAAQSYVLTINSASSASITINDPETITVNDSATQVQLIDVSDAETITVTDIPVITVQGASNIALTASQEQIAYGQTETLTATVTASGSGTPMGTVTFRMGSTVLATENLSSAGIATLPTNTLPVGIDIISAVYNGSKQFVASAPTAYPVQVHQAGTVTSLTESANPIAGYNTTFTATVTPTTSGTPTGTVTFYDGTTTMGTATLSSGVAALATDILPGGSDTITAVYGGNTDYLGSTSNALTPTVADFTMTFSSSAGSLLPGQSAAFTITVTPANGSYNEPITFSVTGLPQGATATFNPSSLTPGGSAGTETITITAPALQSQLEPGPDTYTKAALLLALLLPVAALYRGRRRWRTFFSLMIVALVLGAFTGLSGCGASGFFNQPPKTYTVTVTGSSGAVQHSAKLTLTVE